MKRYKEALAFLLLLTLGLAPRLAVIAAFPTIPISDFKNLILFGQQLHDAGLTNHAVPIFWQNFNFGLPLVLCGLFHLFPKSDPGEVARLATAWINGLLPLLPFFFWRGVLSLRVRVLAGAALGLWPGQVLFSGVVAQDNWTIFPAIALGTLAVRALNDGKRAWPVTAGLFYAAAAAFRADMLLILPLFLAAVRVDLVRTRRRQVVAGVLAAGLGLLGLASYRYAASGRFALSPQIGGLAILGSYIPGASYHGWVAPYPFLASVRPDLLHDRQAMLSQTAGIGLREALRRPWFHALRIASMAGVYAVDGESSDPLEESINAPQSLPPALHERAAALAARLKLPLRIEMASIQALFLAAAIFGFGRRNRPILVLAAAVLLKYIFHVFGVFQGRYFIAATGLEILTIAVAVEEVLRTASPPGSRLAARSLALGAAFGLALWIVPPRLLAFVQSHDIDPQQHTYRFFLQPSDQYTDPAHFADLDCTMDRGVLAGYLPPAQEAMIRTWQPYDPAPGDKAVAECVLTGRGEPLPIVLQVFVPAAPSGLGGRMVQRVELDGEEVYYQDIGLEPWSGWANIPLGNVGAGTRRRVAIEVRALHPEPGGNWAYNSRTNFRVARSSLPMHLAMGRPAAQSSTIDSGTAGSRSASDGKTDGNFYHGSVTSTKRDPNAWWQVDLGSSKAIGSVVIWNRTDCCASRLSDYWVFLSDTPFSPSDTPATLQQRAGTWKSHQTAAPDPAATISAGGAKGRYLRVQLNGTDYLSLAEVQVFGQ
ncbi:MAG TPA: discoidin domain-containing protein [Candidatus Binataceae bacterium]|nr:discoidin domain-containing protein [Candidatus Binataceae bacterium]